MMKWFWDNYTTDAKQRAEIYASPLRASTDQLKGLPPALIETVGDDVCATKVKPTPANWTRPV